MCPSMDKPLKSYSFEVGLITLVVFVKVRISQKVLAGHAETSNLYEDNYRIVDKDVYQGR